MLRRSLICLVFALGIGVRVYHLFIINPKLGFGLGGLYMEFASQIANHGFRLPDTIPFYTQGGLPYAYPPLPFYIEAGLLKGLGINEFLLANLLPPFISIISLFSFYKLTQQMRLGQIEQLAALFTYATMRTAYAEQIEAQGLAEVCGSLLLIGVASAFLLLKDKQTLPRTLWLGIMLGFCTLSSPGTAYGVVPTTGIFALSQARETPVRHWILGLSIALIVIAPFFFTVIGHHGTSVFVDAFVNQHEPEGSALTYVKITVSELLKFNVASPTNFLWNALLFGGVVWLLAKKQWQMPLWLFSLMIIPSEGMWMSALPAALIVGLTCRDLLIPLLREAQRQLRGHELIPVILGVFIISTYTVGDLTQYAADHYWRERSFYAMSQGQLDALQWVKQNTPADANFVILTPSWTVIEWAPHIVRRTVLNVHFGAEWQPDESNKIKQLNSRLIGCLALDCMARQLDIIDYDPPEFYLVIDRGYHSQLVDSKRVSGSLLYDNDEMIVIHVFWHAPQ